MTQSTLPEYWHRTNQPPRRPINWPRIIAVLALALASAALAWTGATEIGLGDIALGKGMLIACAVCFIAASRIGERS